MLGSVGISILESSIIESTMSGYCKDIVTHGFDAVSHNIRINDDFTRFLVTDYPIFSVANLPAIRPKVRARLWLKPGTITG
jgi:hypothetical protein